MQLLQGAGVKISQSSSRAHLRMLMGRHYISLAQALAGQPSPVHAAMARCGRRRDSLAGRRLSSWRAHLRMLIEAVLLPLRFFAARLQHFYLQSSPPQAAPNQKPSSRQPQTQGSQFAGKARPDEALNCTQLRGVHQALQQRGADRHTALCRGFLPRDCHPAVDVQCNPIRLSLQRWQRAPAETDPFGAFGQLASSPDRGSPSAI